MALKACKECGREISTEATTCPHCGKTNPTGTRTSPAAMGCLVIIVVIIVVGIIGGLFSSGGTNSATSSLSTPPSAKEQALSRMKLDYTWSKAGFDNVMLLTFTITNPTTFRVKDVEITCTHYAASGTKIDSNSRTIYEVVPAKGRKRMADFHMGFIHSQAKSSSCEITDAVVE